MVHAAVVVSRRLMLIKLVAKVYLFIVEDTVDCDFGHKFSLQVFHLRRGITHVSKTLVSVKGESFSTYLMR